MAQGKESACNARDVGLISGLGRFPGEGNCKPTPVILTWEIPWTEEPGAYSPWGFKRVEHNSETKQQQFRAGPRKLGQLKMSPWGLLSQVCQFLRQCAFKRMPFKRMRWSHTLEFLLSILSKESKLKKKNTKTSW